MYKMYKTNETLLMTSLQQFYSSKDHIEVLRDVIQKTSPISLRVIDWFVTNYSKNYNTVLFTGKEHINVYTSYRAQLKAFSKRLFDPFRRRHRVMYEYTSEDGTSQSLSTTIGQMAFFRWAIDNKIIEYLNNPENIARVEKDIVDKTKHGSGSGVGAGDTGRKHSAMNSSQPNSKVKYANKMHTFTGEVSVRFD